jgi:predicted heme/steroid binding protein
VGHGGYHLSSSSRWQFGKHQIHHASSDVGKGIAVEEEKGCGSMTMSEELKEFG